MPDTTATENHPALNQDSMPEDKLGERLRALREKLALTHDGLSSLTKIEDQEGRGISRTTIRGYEIGTYKPGARELRILSLSLRVSPTWLLLGEHDSAPSAKGGHTQESRENPTAWRWSNTLFPALAFAQLAASEKQQIVGLVETLYRFQIGELRFRKAKAAIEEISSTFQAIAAVAPNIKDVPLENLKQALSVIQDKIKECSNEDEAAELLAALLPFTQLWDKP